MNHIEFDPSIFDMYGSIKSAYLFIHNIEIISAPPRLKKIARNIEKQIRDEHATNNVLLESKIQDWNHLANEMGINDEKELPANIQLMKSIISGRDIPKINAVVDSANIISAKYRCPVGVFNLDAIISNITIRLALDTEYYLPLMSKHEVLLKHNEIVYADALGVFSRYCKDSDRTKVNEDTTSLLCVIDGTSFSSICEVETARDELLNLLIDVCGSFEYTSGLIVAR